MIGTGHLLVGGAIGAAAATLLPPPLAVPVALACGIASHHLLDFIPHTDAATFWPGPKPRIPLSISLLVACEILLGLSLTGFFYFSLHTTLAFIGGAVGGILPDLLDEVPLWQEHFRRTGFGSVWHRWHTRLHCADMTNSWVTGLVIDVLVVGGGAWALLQM
jgi:hypothetical protein